MLTSRILTQLQYWPASARLMADLINADPQLVSSTLGNLQKQGKVKLIRQNPNVYAFVKFGNTPETDEPELTEPEHRTPDWDEIGWWLRWKAYWHEWDKIKARLDVEREKRIHAFTRGNYEALN